MSSLIEACQEGSIWKSGVLANELCSSSPLMTLLSHLQFKMTASSQATNSVLMKGAGLPEENSFAFQLHLETVDMALPSLKPLH